MKLNEIINSLKEQMPTLASAVHVPHDPARIPALLGTVWRERFSVNSSRVKGFVFIDVMLIDEGRAEGEYVMEFLCHRVNADRTLSDIGSKHRHLYVTADDLRCFDSVLKRIVNDCIDVIELEAFMESTPCL